MTLPCSVADVVSGHVLFEIELRLKIFPVVLGAGLRLFGENSAKKSMRLLEIQTLEGDIVSATYQRVQDA